MKNFDLVTFLITLAGRVAKRRHAKLIEREQALAAALKATQTAYSATIEQRINADYRARDISKVS